MGKITGLIVFVFPPLVKPGCDYGITDIFVLSNYRNKGIANDACKLLFNEFPGQYFVQVIKGDSGAIGFWNNLIAKEGRLLVLEEYNEMLIAYEFETSK